MQTNTVCYEFYVQIERITIEYRWFEPKGVTQQRFTEGSPSVIDPFSDAALSGNPTCRESTFPPYLRRLLAGVERPPTPTPPSPSRPSEGIGKGEASVSGKSMRPALSDRGEGLGARLLPPQLLRVRLRRWRVELRSKTERRRSAAGVDATTAMGEGYSVGAQGTALVEAMSAWGHGDSTLVTRYWAVA